MHTKSYKEKRHNYTYKGT